MIANNDDYMRHCDAKCCYSNKTTTTVLVLHNYAQDIPMSVHAYAEHRHTRKKYPYRPYIPFTPPPPPPLRVQAQQLHEHHKHAKCRKPQPFTPKKPNWQGWPR